MKKINIIGIVLLGQLLYSCGTKMNTENQQTAKKDPYKSAAANTDSPILYQSEDLIVRKVSNHIYEHTSFMETDDSGKVPCNGMIVVSSDEAVIFDTPTSDQTSIELLDYLRYQRNWVINAIVATDWHTECLGGLAVFHKYGVSSYASNQTIKLAKAYKAVVPQQGFENHLVIEVGEKKVYLEYLGEGHASGNIVGYFPEDKLIFGGCLIKAVGTKKENLESVNKKAWSETIYKIKMKYPELKKVIPGDGTSGGPELLDYTMNLFI